MKPNAILIALLATFPLFAAAAPAGAPVTLKEVAQQAVLNSPEVTSKWHNYKAAEEEIGVARGGFLPRVDLTAGIGRENLKAPPTPGTSDYTRSGYTLSLTQSIFEGFALG